MCAKIIAEYLVQFASSGAGAKALNTLTPVALPFDKGGDEWDVQVLESDGDGTLNVYDGETGDAPNLRAIVPVLASENPSVPVRRMNTKALLWVKSSAATWALFRLYGGGCGGR